LLRLPFEIRFSGVFLPCRFFPGASGLSLPLGFFAFCLSGPLARLVVRSPSLKTPRQAFRLLSPLVLPRLSFVLQFLLVVVIFLTWCCLQAFLFFVQNLLPLVRRDFFFFLSGARDSFLPKGASFPQTPFFHGLLFGGVSPVFIILSRSLFRSYSVFPSVKKTPLIPNSIFSENDLGPDI